MDSIDTTVKRTYERNKPTKIQILRKALDENVESIEEIPSTTFDKIKRILDQKV